MGGGGIFSTILWWNWRFFFFFFNDLLTKSAFFLQSFNKIHFFKRNWRFVHNLTKFEFSMRFFRQNQCLICNLLEKSAFYYDILTKSASLIEIFWQNQLFCQRSLDKICVFTSFSHKRHFSPRFFDKIGMIKNLTGIPHKYELTLTCS